MEIRKKVKCRCGRKLTRVFCADNETTQVYFVGKKKGEVIKKCPGCKKSLKGLI